MADHIEEEAQVALIKSLWQRYGKLASFTCLAFIILVCSWQLWQTQQARYLTKLSATYSQLADVNDQVFSDKSAAFLSRYEGSVYADMVHLRLASIAYTQSNTALAQEELSRVIMDAKADTIKDLARTRLARIQIDEKAYSQALATIKTVNESTAPDWVNWVMAQAYVGLKQHDQADHAYQLAIEKCKDETMRANIALEYGIYVQKKSLNKEF